MSDPRDQEKAVPGEERARALLEQLKGVHALDIGRDMVIAIVNFCSTKLGLSDETRPVRDLSDVRVSIEMMRAILGVLDAEHGGRQTSDLHDTLAQLQLAYAHAVQLDNAERAGEAGAPAAAPAVPDAAAAEEAAAPDAETEPEPEAEAEPVPEAEAEPAPEAEPAAAEKPTAAKRPAARKPAAKKKPAAARKPAVPKKPAAAKKSAAAKKPPAAKKKPATRNKPADD